MPGKDAFKKNQRVKGSQELVLELTKDEARARRIAELKAQIKNGTYRPNLERVAERLLPELLHDDSKR